MRRDAGFTLLELLLALLILGISMAAVAQVLSGGVTASRAAEERLRMLAIAQSYLESVGTIVPLEAGERLERLPDGLGARLVIRAMESPAPALPGLRAFSVEVTVDRGDDAAAARVTLTSVRLGMVGQPWAF